MNLPSDASAPAHAVFYFDFRDPSSYLASVQIPRFCSESSVALTLEPVCSEELRLLSGRAAVALGPDDWSALAGRARGLGVELRRPARYPFDGSVPLLAAVFVRERSGQEAMANVARRLWRQIWELGGDPDDPALALAAAREVAVPEAVLRRGLEDPRTRAILERVTRRAADRGVREVPAVFLETVLFQGSAAADELERHLGGGARALEGPSGPAGGDRRPAGGIPDWTFSG